MILNVFTIFNFFFILKICDIGCSKKQCRKNFAKYEVALTLSY